MSTFRKNCMIPEVLRKILIFLYEQEPPVHARLIAKNADTTDGNIYTYIRKYEDEGLLKTIKNSGKRDVYLTDYGRRIAGKVHELDQIMTKVR